MSDKKSYYEQAKLWNQSLDPYQVQILSDILALLPDDAKSILDVGCGDGVITNNLPEHIDVVGADISEEALRYVKRKKVVASIDKLPFHDASFDLVMANDVLEHLEQEIYVQALAELTRVARKYILITTPLLEDLNYFTVYCQSCGSPYHVNWHKRSFNIPALLKVFPSPWKPLYVCISGAPFAGTLSPFTALRQKLGCCYYWDKAICPQCGSPLSPPKEDKNTLLEALGSVEHEFWQARREMWFRRPDRNECIVLWSKLQHADNEKKPAFTQVISSNLCCFTSSQQDNKIIDFTNIAFYLRNYFASFSPWPSFVINKGSFCVLDDGIKIYNDNDGAVSLIMSFPFSLSDGGTLILDCNVSPLSHIKVYIYNTLQTYTLIFESEEKMIFPVSIKVPPGFYRTEKGVMLKIDINISPVIFKTAQLETPEEGYSCKWLGVRKGHNIFEFKKDGQCWRYGLTVDYNGSIPFPLWFHELDNLTIEEFCLFPINEDAYIKETMNILIKGIEEKEKQRDAAEKAYSLAQAEIAQKGKELNNLHLILEEKEKQRDAAEKAYSLAQAEIAQKGKELNNLHLILEEKEKQRDAAEKAYALAQKEINEKNQELLKVNEDLVNLQKEMEKKEKEKQNLVKLLRRRVRRVLVLSHMFPHHNQPGSGPFIHEQVKALREHEMLDVRVISCRPFWMNTLNPLRLLRAWRYYLQEINTLQWQEWEGVPVLYVPYLVGRLIRFWIHGYTYSWAVNKVIDQVWKDFKFDLIHAHTAYLDGMAGVSVAKRFGLPLVITEHTGPFSYLTGKPVVKQKTLQSIRAANQVLTVSQSLCAEVRSHFSDEVRKKIQYLPNGVDVDKFSLPQNWRPDVKAPKLLFVGFFEFIKGLDVLLRAFQMILRVIPDARLILVGGGSQEENLRKLANELSISNNIAFRGYVPREEVARLMREECDIFVLPSRSETFGVVLIEAMACGKPVVATRCGGPESIITKPFMGKLCNPEDPHDLARCIMEVIGSLASFDPVAIRKEVERNFSYTYLAKKIALLYEELG